MAGLDNHLNSVLMVRAGMPSSLAGDSLGFSLPFITTAPAGFGVCAPYDSIT
jgi:hypothetical protein